MSARTSIACLLLINYLLVVGVGCMSRPEDQRGFVMVQMNDVGHNYQECRYLRMDGLENFLAEALANQYQNAPKTPRHHVISIVFGVDAHYLAHITWLLPGLSYQRLTTCLMSYLLLIPAGIYQSVNAPPWR